MFYKKSPQIFLRASNEVYFEKLLVKSYTNNLCHAWMSMEGQSEAYNQTWLNSDKTKIFQSFLEQNPNVGNHFNRDALKVNVENDLHIIGDSETEKQSSEKSSTMFDMSRKNLSHALFNHWIQEEFTERRVINRVFFGPYYRNGTNTVVTYQETVEGFLVDV